MIVFQLHNICRLLMIMSSARINQNHFFSYFINNSVFIGDSSRPAAGKFMFQRFWLSNAFKRRAFYIIDEFFNFFVDFLIVFAPIVVFFESCICKADNHKLSKETVLILPDLPSSMLFKSRALVSGFLKRYSVSSCSSVLLSLTVIFKILPENIFFKPFKKSMFSSSFLSVNVLCIITSILFYKYTGNFQNFLYKNNLSKGAVYA